MRYRVTPPGQEPEYTIFRDLAKDMIEQLGGTLEMCCHEHEWQVTTDFICPVCKANTTIVVRVDAHRFVDRTILHTHYRRGGTFPHERTVHGPDLGVIMQNHIDALKNDGCTLDPDALLFEYWYPRTITSDDEDYYNLQILSARWVWCQVTQRGQTRKFNKGIRLASDDCHTYS